MEEKKERKELRKTIRFSKKELEEITQRANNLHMSFSEYILYSALNKKISTKKTPLYKELITELTPLSTTDTFVSAALKPCTA